LKNFKIFSGPRTIIASPEEIKEIKQKMEEERLAKLEEEE